MAVVYDVGSALLDRILIMVKSKASKSKNKSSIRSSVWIISSIIQSLALVMITGFLPSFYMLEYVIVALLVIGYIFLTKATIDIVTGKITDKDTIRGIQSIHWILTFIGILIVSAWFSLISSLRF